MRGINKAIGNPLMRAEIRLDEEQAMDIAEIFTNVPEIRMGLSATRGWAFVNPPAVDFPGLSAADHKDFQAIVATEYVPFRWQAYLWRKKVGYVPYYFENIPNSKWHRPVIPMWGTGYTTQYFDTRTKRMVYLWYWNERTGVEGNDESMRFYIWDPPNVDGTYTSDAVAALRDWKMTKLATEAGERAAYHGSRMPTFLTHNPPKMKPGDERFKINFGEDEEFEIDREAHNRYLEKGQMSRNSVRNAIQQARSFNTGMTIARRGPIINSESYSEKEGREGDAALDRIVELDPHWNVARAAPPVLLVNPLEHQKRMGQIAAVLVDFPIGMIIEQSGNKSSNNEGNMQVARDRMAEIVASTNRFTEEVILQGEELYFRGLLQKEVVKIGSVTLRKKKRALTRNEMHDLRRLVFNVTVDQEPPPLLSLEHLEKVKDWGIFDQSTIGKHAARILNIPQSDVKITKLLMPAQLEKAKIDVNKEKNKMAAQKEAQKPSPAKKAKTSKE